MSGVTEGSNIHITLVQGPKFTILKFMVTNQNLGKFKGLLRLFTLLKKNLNNSVSVRKPDSKIGILREKVKNRIYLFSYFKCVKFQLIIV